MSRLFLLEMCASCIFDQHLRHLSCRNAIYSVALTVHKIYYYIGVILIVALHMKCGGREREYQRKSAHKMLLVYFGVEKQEDEMYVIITSNMK